MALPIAGSPAPRRPERFTPELKPVRKALVSHDRDVLVARLAQQLTHRRASRMRLLTIVAAAGAAAFLCSVLMLWSGIDFFQSMAIRYASAALTGYAAFIGLIRIWIIGDGSLPDFDLDVAEEVIEAARSRSASWSPDVDVALELETTGGDASTWRAVRRSVMDAGDRLDGWDFDLGDFMWLAVAAACAVAGVLAIAYVIYIAPVLLAEIVLDAAVMSAVYRRLREDEAGNWLTTTLTRTWAPASVVVVFAMIAGLALQLAAPEAHSIGGVIRAFLQ